MENRDESMRENREEEPRTTGEILSPGLALSADRKTMEERVRGIFGRPRSTALAAVAAFLIVALALILCFTTALRPVKTPEAGADGPGAEISDAAQAAEMGAGGEDKPDSGSPVSVETDGEGIRAGTGGTTAETGEENSEATFALKNGADAGNRVLSEIPAEDETEMREKAETFLRQFFDDLLRGSTDWGYDEESGTEYGGIVLRREPEYTESILMMKKWIEYKRMLADYGRYRRETDIGRFGGFETLEFYPRWPETSVIDRETGKELLTWTREEYRASGYFRAAFGTFSEFIFVRDGGSMRIVYADFPDWTEYLEMKEAFRKWAAAHPDADKESSAWIDEVTASRYGDRISYSAWASGYADAAELLVGMLFTPDDSAWKKEDGPFEYSRLFIEYAGTAADEGFGKSRRVLDPIMPPSDGNRTIFPRGSVLLFDWNDSVEGNNRLYAISTGGGWAVYADAETGLVARADIADLMADRPNCACVVMNWRW